MCRPYPELNALPPEAFLKPEDFVTDFDSSNPDLAEQQYQIGLKFSAEHGRIIIRANGTWGAETEPYIWVMSYEGIGYHAHTASLLRGFLDGPAPIDVERRQADGSVTTTRIKEGR